jgi:hypothetical protein
MGRTKQRTKAIQNLVDEANKYFRKIGMKDEFSSDLFQFVCEKLIQKNMYHGYNFHVRKIADDGTEYYPLAGTSDKTKYDFIQIW